MTELSEGGQIGGVPGTNTVLDLPRDTSTVWFDPIGGAAGSRMIQTVETRLSMCEPLISAWTGTLAFTLCAFVSPDGAHWEKVAESPVHQP
ncbi:MAG: hypothetical protein AAFW98_16500 [Pseudomonadota bacterium]